jgi:Ca-activated chloride channel family protein
MRCAHRFTRLVVPLLCLSAAIWSLPVGVAHGQGLLVNVTPGQQVRLPRPIIIHPPHPVPRPRPQPPDRYAIKALNVNVRLVAQVAQVQVAQTFVNTGSRQLEVCFVFPLPYDGAIDRLTLLVDGKEYPAKLLPADEARRLYESIVRKNRDPALLEWLGTGLFKTSVFPVPPGAERKVTLRYTQLCRRNEGLTDFLFPLSTAKYTSQPLKELTIRVAIEASSDIKNVYSPTHAIDVQRSDNRHAVVTFRSTNKVPSNDFRLFYDVGRGPLGTSVVSYRPEGGEDGYFLLLASPTIEATHDTPPRKTVLLVVDRSGSMSGKKLEQAKGALRFVLENLREEDLFNIVAYDSQVESFRPELQKYNESTRQAALGFVNGLYAGGSTDIDSALQHTFGQLRDSSRPNYVIFLTDGLPTAGVTGEAKIVARARDANRVRARLFAFGVGYDVNSRLLDRLARSGFGQSEYVRPDEDIEASVSRLYRRIGTPAMTDVQVTFDVEGHRPEEGPVVNRTYPREVYDLFAGDQLVLVGRYRKAGAAKVTISGRIGGAEKQFDFPASLVAHSGEQSNRFVERLWAVRRVGEIIDQLDLKGRNEELTKELVQLATRHGILTPYTSFLADETANFRDLALGRREAGVRLQALNRTAGRSGFSQRASKGLMQRAAQAPASGGYGGAYFYDANDGARVDVPTVRTVGGKTFFYRGGQWVDSTVSAEEEQRPVKIRRYSREYFDLAGRYGRSAAQYLAIDEPVLIKLDNTVYQWTD